MSNTTPISKRSRGSDTPDTPDTVIEGENNKNIMMPMMSSPKKKKRVDSHTPATELSTNDGGKIFKLVLYRMPIMIFNTGDNTYQNINHDVNQHTSSYYLLEPYTSDDRNNNIKSYDASGNEILIEKIDFNRGGQKTKHSNSRRKTTLKNKKKRHTKKKK